LFLIIITAYRNYLNTFLKSEKLLYNPFLRGKRSDTWEGEEEKMRKEDRKEIDGRGGGEREERGREDRERIERGREEEKERKMYLSSSFNRQHERSNACQKVD
jgi:hypothetical protein